MNNITVYGKTRDGKVEAIEIFDTEQQAEIFCEQWGWMFDDGNDCYSLYYGGHVL